MKTLSNEGSPRTIARLLTSAFLACLVVAAVCVVVIPGLAVSPAGDAQKAYDDWVAANEAVKEARKKAQDAQGKLTNIMAVSATGGITAGEERALAKARDEVAKAEAALKEAEARLEAARLEMEKAIAELEDEKLKKELMRKRDGYIAAQRFTAIAPAKASVETKSGLHTVTFDTSPGRVIVNLPDDMAAGDTISGTVVTEPKGTTAEEKAKNQEKLNTYVLDLEGTKVPTREPRFTWVPTTPLPSQPVRYQLRIYEVLGDQTANARIIAETLITPAAIRLPLDNTATLTPMTSSSGDVVHQFRMPDSTIFSIDVSTANAKTATDPPLAQQGRPLEIFGPFDGNLSNTTLRYGPANSTVHEFEKNSDSVSGGFGLLRTLAESPRKIVFASPNNVTGPMGIMVRERDNVATGTARNVGVNLSAPKTELLKGEQTELEIEVRGLKGIKKDVPLQLDAKGVITMAGGNFQNLRIKPTEVQADGRYTTTRTITGVKPGGFNVSATVIVGPYDACLQDDSDPNRIFHFNSFTGDYIFACGGGSCRPGGSTGGTQTGGTTGKPGGTTQPGGTVQPGGTTPPGGTGTPPIVPPPPVTLTGVGKPVMKGCIITLSHNAPDRRVFARLDACTKSGDASVETKSPKTNFNITDKNTADNTVGSPTPK